jgi:hypothetical protein
LDIECFVALPDFPLPRWFGNALLALFTFLGHKRRSDWIPLLNHEQIGIESLIVQYLFDCKTPLGQISLLLISNFILMG